MIIMDDGLQNPSLAKDLSLAVVDAGRGIGNGRVMPAGPLRAPLPSQLKRVDALILNRPHGPRVAAGEVAVDDHPDADRRAATSALDAAGFGGPRLLARTVPTVPTVWLRDLPLIAYAGIGAPQRFFALLELAGAVIAERQVFPDHHMLTETEAARLLGLAARHHAMLVTTEKDLARLSGSIGLRQELVAASRALAIKVELEEPDRQRLASLVLNLIHKRRSSAASHRT